MANKIGRISYEEATLKREEMAGHLWGNAHEWLQVMASDIFRSYPHVEDIAEQRIPARMDKDAARDICISWMTEYGELIHKLWMVVNIHPHLFGIEEAASRFAETIVIDSEPF